jgi:hypothetical protein
MQLFKTNTDNQILTALVEAIGLHQAAFKDFESAGRGLSNTAHPLDMKFWTQDLEKALGNKDETVAIMLRRQEGLLTHMSYYLNAHEAYDRIVDCTQELTRAIVEAYVYLDSERPRDAALIKANLILAAQEHDRKLVKLTTFDGPRGQLHTELNNALTKAFEKLLSQSNYCHHSSVASALRLSGSTYPISPVVSNDKKAVPYQDLRNLGQPNKVSKFTFPSSLFTTMEEELEELRQVWKIFSEYAKDHMYQESRRLGEYQFGDQLLRLASGELHTGYAENLSKQQKNKRLSYEQVHTQYLTLGAQLEATRKKVAQSLQKAKEELRPLVPESKESPRHAYSYSVKPAEGPCKPYANKQQVQQGIFRCLYADLLLRDIGYRLEQSLDEYGTDLSGNKGKEVLDAELTKLRALYEVKIQMHKDLAKTNALKLQKQAATAPEADASGVTEKHFPPVQPPAGAITNVY